MKRFQNQVAVITGAGSGIGKATAIQLADEGATVVLVGRTKEKLEAVAEIVSERSDNQHAYVYVADVTAEEEVELLAAYLKDNFEVVHVLINNAGTSSSGSILQLEEWDWEYVQKTNVTSVFLMAKHVGPLLADAKAENKAIVNIASLSGHKAGAKIPHYSTAKAAVIHLTKALAGELASNGVRVNSVSPGFIETPMTKESLENASFNQAIELHTLLKRIGRAEEVAKAVAFLASSDSSYVTGTDLLIDGGWLTV
ncbi:SDR family NAD(P)-dependent oxidoreductase [Halalkalibacter alkalisediminis]|uniref:SDR family NAD(P)-dependent oxidoreductase n=1 Tax=Halalkalibacter alkalisediminis TaxID=935616 RepID=A0ABV6NB76_9BACI|nr:SDR family oxidoreductase [Halalkalibacter alkalisediminis]